MNMHPKWTALAIAVAAAVALPAHAEENIVYNETTNIVRNDTTNVYKNYTDNFRWDTAIRETFNLDVDVDVDQNLSESYDLRVVRHDERRTRDNHAVDVSMRKHLSLTSDISFSGDPTISGDIAIDSAAIAVIDNRQAAVGNQGYNDKVSNDASIGDDVASAASGNLMFNAAAGDNNVQDNAAALAAADASFAFGMADAEVFVGQVSSGNATLNMGVTNTASVSDNAFSGASGNIAVNVASGSGNVQKNAMAASVATSAYAQATVSSNQVSEGNGVSNTGSIDTFTERTQVTLSGSVSGMTLAAGGGRYAGSTSGSYGGQGAAYQMDNFYLDTWDGELPHPNGQSTGHIDMDGDIQNAVGNPFRDGVGGIAFDTTESGSYEGSEEGELGFLEIGIADLDAVLSGEVVTYDYVAVAATNTASLSGSAFSGASGNIGVNIAAGTGNLQANSLSMAVAQPSTGGGGGGE